MSHFAQVINNIVQQVIVAEQEFINSLPDPSNWIQTSYNTREGVHILGGTPLRKNYAGIGYTYDPIRDAFIPMKPYNSWSLLEDTCQWVCPVSYPTDGKYYEWDEETISWKNITFG